MREILINMNELYILAQLNTCRLMRKKNILFVTFFIAAIIAGCKKEASKSNQNTKTDNNKLIVGSWQRTFSADTVIYQDGTKNIVNEETYNDYVYLFKSDGTGTYSLTGIKAADIKYSLADSKINIIVVQAYNRDGSSSIVHITPYSLKFIKLTDNQLVLRSDTTVTENGSSTRTIMIDTYTKYQ